jgi:WD repeat and SOF domain-containing protein 1
LNKREEEYRNYSKKIVEKYQHIPEIRKIRRHKNLPKYILNKNKELQVKKESKYRKLKNKEMNSKLGTIEHEPEKTERIVKTEIIKK